MLKIDEIPASMSIMNKSFTTYNANTKVWERSFYNIINRP